MTPVVRLRSVRHRDTRSPRLQALLGDIPMGPIVALNTKGGLSSCILVEEEVVGLVTIQPNGACDIAVHPDFQAKGVGLAALQQAIEAAFGRGIPRVTARAEIGRPGSFLAQKLGAVEISRSTTEVFYEITPEHWSQRGDPGQG